jgi:DNA-binding MarR family transcriptional regulator
MKLEDELSQKKFKSEFHKAALNIIYTSNWLTSKHSANLKPHDITQQQFNILRILRGQHPHPASIKLLKERMMDKMSDASRLVEKLRLKGLLERKICKADRRNVDVIITQKGLDLLASLDHLDDNFKEIIALDSNEVEQLNELLDKLRG